MVQSNSVSESTSVNDLIAIVIQGPETNKEKIKLINEIRKSSPILADRWLYRYSVWFLGAAVTMTIGIGFGMVWSTGNSVPDGLIALGSAAVGALATLISPTISQES